jgi:PAS domain S-box-containing protein
MPDDQLHNLALVVTEVVSNAVRHSTGSTDVRLAITVKDAYLCVQVTDSGDGLVPHPGAIAAQPGAGFGLFLVEQLTRRWGVTRENAQTRVWFEIDRVPNAVPDEVDLDSGAWDSAEVAPRANGGTRLEDDAFLRARQGRSFPTGGVFNAALDAVIVMEADGRVRDWNPAAERIFGYAYEEALGAELAELIIPPHLRDKHREAVARFRETRRGTILDKRLELVAIRANGEEFPVELTVTRVGGAEPPLFAGFVRDLTRRKNAERRRDELSARLALLAEAGLVLDRSLDLRETFMALANLMVPEVAELCVIDLLGRDGDIRGAVAAAGADPDAARAVEQMRRDFPLDPDGSHPVAQVVRTQRPMLLPEMDEEYLASIAQSESHFELMQRLRYKSAIVVPLIARRRILGVLSLLRLGGGVPYEEDDVGFAEDIARRAAVAVDNAYLYEQTRHVAATLQESLLPASLPELPGVTLAARYRAASAGDQVGGDFYDAFELDGGAWGVVIGDVCGKGAEAAALTALARYSVRTAAACDADPANVLSTLNTVVYRDQGPFGRFLTVAYARVEASEDRLAVRLALGGHPRPLVLRADSGDVELVEAAGPLIGIHERVRPIAAEVMLRAGDTLLLFTDGLPDAGAPGRILTDDDLCSIVRAHATEGPDEIAAALEQAALTAGEPRDDIAILGLRFTGAGTPGSASQRYAAGSAVARVA